MSAGAWDRIECVQGDIAAQAVDAVVNAAKSSLRGGGGVDGALHRAAGPGLLAECVERHPHGCPVGEARLTDGHELPARFVIHTVGPVWHGGGEDEAAKLASCYRSSIRLAAQNGIKTIAFPAISTGAYGYPESEAARVALATLADELERETSIELARVVLFGEASLGVHRAVLDELRG